MAAMTVIKALVVVSTMSLGALSEQNVAAVTPVQKVIQLLDGMMAKGKKEKQTEEVEFAKFHEWCDGLRAEKTKSIEDASMQIKALQADMDKAASDAEVLSGEVADLEAETAEFEKEFASAKVVRKSEKADYSAQHLDYSESIDALERAIATLKAKKTDVKQSLLQVHGSQLIPADAKAKIEAFLELGAPEPNAYEFQSSSVVDMLEKLRLKFQDELLACEKAEMNARHNYEAIAQQLTDDIKANKDSISQKTEQKAGRLEDGASAKGDQQVTEASKADDEKTLSDTNAQCVAQSKEYEANQVLRSQELEALQKAADIIASGAVAGNADTHLPAASLLQAKTRTALAQLRTTANVAPANQKAAVAYLQAQAKKLGSRYLSVLAAHVAEDPFGKVKKMIKDLIIKLSEEANAEADKNAYCTTELATNKQTRDNKGSEVEELTANVDQRSANSEQLAAEITELSDAIAESQGQRSTATKNRGEEKATNAQTVADAKEAQVAVAQAITVLKEFYGKAGDSSMLQVKEPYQGMGASSGGVLGMLDVVLSDFARLETDTSTAEDQAATAYQTFMAESEENNAVKDTEMKHKDKKKRQNDEALRGLRKQTKLTQEELDRALDYYDKLKADCLDNGLSYEARVQGREEEIKSLQEALRILDGEDLA